MACAVPSQVVPTDSFKTTFGDEEVEKFMKMTGITETRRASTHQTASDLGVAAARHLLSKKGVDPQSIKAVVFGTHSPDYRRPASAFVIQHQLGVSQEAVVFDISLGCSSTVYGIQVVAAMMANSDMDKALLIIGDTATKSTNPKDRASIMLQGEASVALLLEKVPDAAPITALLRSDGAGFSYLIVPGGGYRDLHAPAHEEICQDGNPRSLHNSIMQGMSVFTFTISDVPKAIKDFFQLTTTSVDDYDCFAFHQANLLILKQIAKKIRIPEEKMPISLPRFGNTSGASQILTLCETYGAVEGQELKTLLVAFGVGISWGVVGITINTSDIFPIIEDDSVFQEGLFDSVTQF